MTRASTSPPLENPDMPRRRFGFFRLLTLPIFGLLFLFFCIPGMNALVARKIKKGLHRKGLVPEELTVNLRKGDFVVRNLVRQASEQGPAVMAAKEISVQGLNIFALLYGASDTRLLRGLSLAGLDFTGPGPTLRCKTAGIENIQGPFPGFPALLRADTGQASRWPTLCRAESVSLREFFFNAPASSDERNNRSANSPSLISVANFSARDLFFFGANNLSLSEARVETEDTQVQTASLQARRLSLPLSLLKGRSKQEPSKAKERQDIHIDGLRLEGCALLLPTVRDLNASFDCLELQAEARLPLCRAQIRLDNLKMGANPPGPSTPAPKAGWEDPLSTLFEQVICDVCRHLGVGTAFFASGSLEVSPAPTEGAAGLAVQASGKADLGALGEVELDCRLLCSDTAAQGTGIHLPAEPWERLRLAVEDREFSQRLFAGLCTPAAQEFFTAMAAKPRKEDAPSGASIPEPYLLMLAQGVPPEEARAAYASLAFEALQTALPAEFGPEMTENIGLFLHQGGRLSLSATPAAPTDASPGSAHAGLKAEYTPPV